MPYGSVKVDSIVTSTQTVAVDDLVVDGQATIELGHASDTTLSRSAAGVLAVEGVVIPSISSTNTLTNKTLTNPAISGTIKEGLYAFGGSPGVEIDPSNGSIQLIQLYETNCTPKGTNFINGQKVLLMISDGSGQTPGTLTWTDSTFGYAGVQWVGGYPPKLATSGYTNVQLWKAYGTVYGALLGDVQTLDSPELKYQPYVNGSYRSNITAVSALDIDCSVGNYYTKTITSSSTFTFSNIPASRSYSFTICVTHDSGTITWPASVKWPQNTAPVLTTYRNHKFMFSTYNGGTVWYGAALPNYSY